MHPERAARATRARFAWHLEAEADAIPDARHAFQDWLRESEVSSEDIADMAVVLSELASNALAGAEGTGKGIDIVAAIDGDELQLEVTNQVGGAVDHVLRWDLDDPLRGGGRGLMIVRAYTDTLEIDSSGSTVTVRCSRHLEVR